MIAKYADTKALRHRLSFVFAALCLCMTSEAIAQSSAAPPMRKFATPLTPKTWILSLNGGVTKGLNDFNDTRISAGGALQLKRHLLDFENGRKGSLYAQFAIGLYDMQWRTNDAMMEIFDTTRIRLNSNNRSSIMPFAATMHWRYPVGTRAQLFLGAGLEAIHFQTMNPMGQPLEQPQDAYGKWTLGIPISVEFEFFMSDHLALNFHASVHPTLTDYLDGFRAGRMTDALFVAGLGISYSFPQPPRDSDFDGLSDYEEIYIYGTDPFNPDTDGDGLRDGDEVHIYGTSPLHADTDGDGLRDGDEVHIYGTDPLKRDTDGDGLTDMEEIRLGTSPTRADTDGDGLPDGVELARGTDPLNRDTDGDGIPDGMEIHSSPLLRDTDGDGLSDAEESAYGLRPNDADFDGDGLPDYLEILIGTDPKKADTDNDGVTDYAEYYGLMTDPRNPDTDGDGIPDGFDPWPLGPNNINPVHKVYWTLADLFTRDNTVDETSKSFTLLLHLLRSAPTRHVLEVELEVVGHDFPQVRERRDHLQEFLRRMTRSWDIPPITYREDIVPRSFLDLRLRYIPNMRPGK
jgi:hypothetical protein